MAACSASGRGDEVKVRGGPGKGELHIDVRLLRHDDEQLLLVRMRRHDVNRAGRRWRSRPGPDAGGRTHARRPAADRHRRPRADGQRGLHQPRAAGVGGAAARRVAGPLAGPARGRPERDAGHAAPAGLGAPVCHRLRSEQGAEAEVEISAVSLPELDPPALAFLVRHVGRRLSVASHSVKTAPRSVEQLAQLVGRMPLKDLVRESSDLIERCASKPRCS
jgi:hypothetical protein